MNIEVPLEYIMQKIHADDVLNHMDDYELDHLVLRRISSLLDDYTDEENIDLFVSILLNNIDTIKNKLAKDKLQTLIKGLS